MPELSTLLRQRLRATEDHSNQHPDPDTLSAYVEELLPVQERDTVVKHLSLCSECRDVVALTMPDAVAEGLPVAGAPVVSSATPRRRWFLSPAFGLTGSIAVMVLGVALILSLPVNRHPQTGHDFTQQQQAAKLPSEAPVPAPASANSSSASDANQITQPVPSANRQQLATSGTIPVVKPNTGPAVAAGLRENGSLTPVSGPRARPQAPAKAQAPIYTAGLQTQDYINKTFIANTYPQASTAMYRDLPQAPAPMQSNLAFAPPAVVASNSFQNPNSFEIISNNAGGSGRGMITFYPPPQESRGSSLISKIVDLGKHPLARRSGPPIPSSSLGTSAMFKPGMAGGQPGEAIAAAKTADQSDGGLSQSHAFSSKALASIPRNQGIGAGQYEWKVVQGKLLKSSDLNHWSEENPAGENLEYSVVSPNGSEIWAGGNDAALLHSRDAGATWERVTLGAAATGTINSIEVAGQNVLVRSSSGQSWASQDGGKSWMLQD